MACIYRVGSSFPPCYIACFDEYENQIPFTSVPSLEVELKASSGFHAIIDNDKIDANRIDGILKVEVFKYFHYLSINVMTTFLLLRECRFQIWPLVAAEEDLLQLIFWQSL